METNKIKEILDSHKLWLDSEETKGKRADFSSMDLKKADLRVRLGCHDRTVEEWNADFWNNDTSFSESSPAGQNRLMIYKFMRDWLYANFSSSLKNEKEIENENRI